MNVETREQSKQWLDIHSPNMQKKFKQTSVCQERSDDGGIHTTRDHNKVRSVLPNTKKLRRAILNKSREMLTSSAVLLHDNARPYTTARNRALLEYFNWELFDHPSYSPHLAPSDYYLFIYLKNWLASKSFNSNELMEGIKTWLSSQEAHKNLFTYTSASNPALC
jgi:hypothetical protein